MTHLEYIVMTAAGVAAGWYLADGITLLVRWAVGAP